VKVVGKSAASVKAACLLLLFSWVLYCRSFIVQFCAGNTSLCVSSKKIAWLEECAFGCFQRKASPRSSFVPLPPTNKSRSRLHALFFLPYHMICPTIRPQTLFLCVNSTYHVTNSARMSPDFHHFWSVCLEHLHNPNSTKAAFRCLLKHFCSSVASAFSGSHVDALYRPINIYNSNTYFTTV